MDPTTLAMKFDASSAEKASTDMDRVAASATKVEGQALEAAKALGYFQDSAGRWRSASGRFVSVTEQARVGLDKLGDQAKTTCDQLHSASGRGLKGFSSLSAGARPLLLQLSQVGQQGQVTGNYLQALGIQAFDIGLLFGSVGIVAGAAAGAVLTLASSMDFTGTSAKTLKKDMEALTDAMGRTRQCALTWVGLIDISSRRLW